MKKLLGVVFICLFGFMCVAQDLSENQISEITTAIEQYNKKDFESAFRVFNKYAGTNPQAAAYLGRCYFNGFGCIKNIALAEKYFLIAANAKNPVGLNGLGAVIQDKEPQKAFALFEEAAQSGIKEALHNLGRSYVLGIGCKADSKKGYELLVKAVEKGSIPSAEFLGMWYYLTDNWEGACKYLTIATNAGLINRQKELFFSQAMLDIYAKKYTDAYLKLKKCVSWNGYDEIRALEKLSFVCIKLGKNSEAENFLNSCIVKLNSYSNINVNKKADLCFAIAVNLKVLKHDLAEQEKFLLMSYELRKKSVNKAKNLSLAESELIYADLIYFYSKNKMKDKLDKLMQEMISNTSEDALKEIQKIQSKKK